MRGAFCHTEKWTRNKVGFVQASGIWNSHSVHGSRAWALGSLTSNTGSEQATCYASWKIHGPKCQGTYPFWHFGMYLRLLFIIRSVPMSFRLRLEGIQSIWIAPLTQKQRSASQTAVVMIWLSGHVKYIPRLPFLLHPWLHFAMFWKIWSECCSCWCKTRARLNVLS